MKRSFAIILVIAGIVLIGISKYIKHRVEEGKMQIGSAQSKVDQSNQAFSWNPATKEVGKGVTGAAQGKINEASAEVRRYENLAQVLQIVGIILIVVGVACFIFIRKR